MLASMDTDHLHSAIIDSYRSSSSKSSPRRQPMSSSSKSSPRRQPMPSVPLRNNNSNSNSNSNSNKQRRTSRTDHGQGKQWKVERRAAASLNKSTPNTNANTLDFNSNSTRANNTSPRRISAMERDGISPAKINKAASNNRRMTGQRNTSPHRNRKMRSSKIDDDVFRPPPAPSTALSGGLTTYGGINNDTNILKPSRISRDKIQTNTTGKIETCKDLGRGWVQRTAPKQIGTFKRAGTHTIAECRGGKFYICTREPTNQGKYLSDAVSKCSL